MCEIKKIKAASMFPLISEILDHGQNARISVSGDSMYPFLRDSIDSVELTKGRFERLSRGDIVMIQRTDGYYVMHRIIKKNKDCFFMVGDAQQWIEGPLFPEQLIAEVTAIWRNERRIPCSNIWWRLLSGIWLFLRPFRLLIIRVNTRIRRLVN